MLEWIKSILAFFGIIKKPKISKNHFLMKINPGNAKILGPDNIRVAYSYRGKTIRVVAMSRNPDVQVRDVAFRDPVTEKPIRLNRDEVGLFSGKISLVKRDLDLLICYTIQ